ncbi:MAG: DUF1294 domain-containing protein [Planctomycetes bacterium]|nr:DUF1294 domain-containing protein [Planctomycetota bacterium]
MLWFALANFVALCLYGLDKWKAQKQRERVPERVLLMWASLGGGTGALVGMALFRHKIRKPSFWVANIASVCALAYAMRELIG